MEGRMYGYARVSSKEQNLDRQIEALKARGVNERDIITDKKSGKDFKREGYNSLKEQLLRKGDILVIKELDRLGRNYTQIKDEWRELQDMGVDIEVLDTPMLNTTNKQDIQKQLIVNIVFELMSYIAENERHKIRKRQKEGIAVAKGKGVKFGRKAVKKPCNWKEIYALWSKGYIKGVEAMKMTGLRRSTFYKFVREEKEAEEMDKELGTILYEWKR